MLRSQEPLAPSRVLFLAPQPFHSLRGACIANLLTIKALAAMGFDVDVLTFPGGEDPRIAGVRILRLPSLPGLRWIPIGFSRRKLLLDAVMGAAMIPLLAAGRYGVVHASEDSVFPAAILKRFFRFRLVYDMDDILSQRLEQVGVLRSASALRLARAVERWMMRSADQIVANSAHTASYAAGVVGPRGVLSYDHVPFDAGWVESQAMDGSAHLPRERNADQVILYAGNMEPYQGVELLLESLPSVLRRLPGARCVIVGGEKEQIDRLRRRAEELGIDAMLTWLGQRPFPEAFRLMRSADVLVSPMTQVKAVPMKLYAYAASGRPIVATTLPNNTEILDQDTALLVDPSPVHLADGIVTLLEDRALGERLAANARGLACRCAERSALVCLLEAYGRLSAFPGEAP